LQALPSQLRACLFDRQQADQTTDLRFSSSKIARHPEGLG
jgi:hypothetical protein